MREGAWKASIADYLNAGVALAEVWYRGDTQILEQVHRDQPNVSDIAEYVRLCRILGPSVDFSNLAEASQLNAVQKTLEASSDFTEDELGYCHSVLQAKTLRSIRVLGRDAIRFSKLAEEALPYYGGRKMSPDPNDKLGTLGLFQNFPDDLANFLDVYESYEPLQKEMLWTGFARFEYYTSTSASTLLRSLTNADRPPNYAINLLYLESLGVEHTYATRWAVAPGLVPHIHNRRDDLPKPIHIDQLSVLEPEISLTALDLFQYPTKTLAGLAALHSVAGPLHKDQFVAGCNQAVVDGELENWVDFACEQLFPNTTPVGGSRYRWLKSE